MRAFFQSMKARNLTPKVKQLEEVKIELDEQQIGLKSKTNQKFEAKAPVADNSGKYRIKIEFEGVSISKDRFASHYPNLPKELGDKP